MAINRTDGGKNKHFFLNKWKERQVPETSADFEQWNEAQFRAPRHGQYFTPNCRCLGTRLLNPGAEISWEGSDSIRTKACGRDAIGFVQVDRQRQDAGRIRAVAYVLGRRRRLQVSDGSHAWGNETTSPSSDEN